MENTSDKGYDWKKMVRQARVTCLNMFEKFWKEHKPKAIEIFLSKGLTLREAEELAVAMKKTLSSKLKKKQKALFEKIVQQKVDEYKKRKGIDSKEDIEKRNANPSSKLASAASSSQTTGSEPSGSFAEASHNNESNALTYPGVASKVLAPAEAKSSGDWNEDKKDKDDEEPPEKRARFKK